MDYSIHNRVYLGIPSHWNTLLYAQQHRGFISCSLNNITKFDTIGCLPTVPMVNKYWYNINIWVKLHITVGHDTPIWNSNLAVHIYHIFHFFKLIKKITSMECFIRNSIGLISYISQKIIEITAIFLYILQIKNKLRIYFFLLNETKKVLKHTFKASY